MLKIANVCLSRSWGGLEMTALKWAENLIGRGHEVTSMLPAGSRLSEEARSRGLRQVTVPLASRSFDPRASSKIRSLLRRDGIEIVQAHASKDLWILYPALLGMPAVRLFYLSGILFKNTSKKDWLHRLVYRRLTGAIVLTEIHRKYFALNTCVPPEKIAVIPHGLEVDRHVAAGDEKAAPGERAAARAAVRAELGLRDGEIALGCTSRIDRQKGQYELIEAFRVAGRRHANLKLVLVGEPTFFEGEQYADFLRRKVAEYGLAERVVFAGFRSDIPRVLSALDVFVMPSYEETFGLCLIEAMLSGLPCVSTDAGGVPEILEGGKLGLLAEPKSVEGLARAIQTLVENPDLARDLGAKARESARRRFDLSVVVGRIEDLYAGKM
jgi:glycosyltransferase involved in cell wall biosynthesis